MKLPCIECLWVSSPLSVFLQLNSWNADRLTTQRDRISRFDIDSSQTPHSTIHCSSSIRQHYIQKMTDPRHPERHEFCSHSRSLMDSSSVDLEYEACLPQMRIPVVLISSTTLSSTWRVKMTCKDFERRNWAEFLSKVVTYVKKRSRFRPIH